MRIHSLAGATKVSAAIAATVAGIFGAVFALLPTQAAFASNQRPNSFTGQNGMLLFTSNDHLYESDPATGDRQRWPVERYGQASNPSWSPNGRKVAFAAGGHIWIAKDTANAHARRLVGGGEPAWSPDGRRIVFMRTVGFSKQGKAGVPTLRVVDVNGNDDHAIGIDAKTPTWSPNGRWIAATSDTTKSSPHPHVIKFHPNGKDRTVITRSYGLSSSPKRDGEFNPDWSPSGKQLVYYRLWNPKGQRTATSGDLYIVNSNGRHDHQILQNSGGDAVYSPDGTQIAYCDGKIMILDLATGQSHAADNSTSPDADYQVSWQPRPIARASSFRHQAMRDDELSSTVVGTPGALNQQIIERNSWRGRIVALTGRER